MPHYANKYLAKERLKRFLWRLLPLTVAAITVLAVGKIIYDSFAAGNFILGLGLGVLAALIVALCVIIFFVPNIFIYLIPPDED